MTLYLKFYLSVPTGSRTGAGQDVINLLGASMSEDFFFCSVSEKKSYTTSKLRTGINKSVYPAIKATTENIIVGSHVWIEDPEIAWIDGQATKINGQEVQIDTTRGNSVLLAEDSVPM
ncbi:uncharacterized protein LOC108204251 [Daucus carota subsp. sativus]|uniref:uncharacterized protein LOC108204251 n=1 Tax=Daucus carota subsp. sativus TaxID=79200 RepID=UPI0030836DB0